MTTMTAFAAGLLVLATAGVGTAAPNLADIAGCNEEAYAAIRGGPSASPGPVEPPRRQPRVPGTTETSQGPTDPTGSVITQGPDPLLEGMAAERADDPLYREAYRDCMKRRSAAPAR